MFRNIVICNNINETSLTPRRNQSAGVVREVPNPRVVVSQRGQTDRPTDGRTCFMRIKIF